MFLSRLVLPRFRSYGLTRAFSAFSAQLEKALPPRRKIDEAEIEEKFVKGSGPGGQVINKTSSAVQIRHTATGIVVKNQETRSREQNRKLARRILAEKLEELEKGSESRTAIKTERARSKKASRDKKARRKYRKLEEGKVGGADGEGEENVGVSEEGGREEGAGGGEKG